MPDARVTRDLGNSSPSFVGATSSSFPSSEGVKDAVLGFNESTEPDRTKVDVEQAAVNLLEADVMTYEEPGALAGRWESAPAPPL